MSGRDTAAPTGAATATDRLPLVVYVLALGTFLMLTTEFVVAGLLPGIATDLGVDVASAALLITVFAVGMVIGAPLMAMLTLRLPHRTTLLLALAVYVLGHVAVALGPDLSLLLVARFVTALATGAFWAVAAVVATRAVEASRASRAVGLVNAGGMLATVLGVPLGAVIGQAVGWRGTFWVLAVAAVVVAVVVARHVPHQPVDTAGVSVRRELSALRSGRLWLALAACVTTTGGVMAAYSYITPLLTGRTGLGEGVIPVVLALFGAGALIGSVVGGRLGDTHPHRTTVLVPLASTAVLLGLLAVADLTFPTALLVGLLGLFGLSANPVLIALAVRHAGRAPTIGASLSVSAFNLGTAAGTALAGMTLGSSLGVSGPLLVGACVVALTVLPAGALAVLAARHPHDSSPVPAHASGHHGDHDRGAVTRRAADAAKPV